MKRSIALRGSLFFPFLCLLVIFPGHVEAGKKEVCECVEVPLRRVMTVTDWGLLFLMSLADFSQSTESSQVLTSDT